MLPEEFAKEHLPLLQLSHKRILDGARGALVRIRAEDGGELFDKHIFPGLVRAAQISSIDLGDSTLELISESKSTGHLDELFRDYVAVSCAYAIQSAGAATRGDVAGAWAAMARAEFFFGVVSTLDQIEAKSALLDKAARSKLSSAGGFAAAAIRFPKTRARALELVREGPTKPLDRKDSKWKSIRHASIVVGKQIYKESQELAFGEEDIAEDNQKTVLGWFEDYLGQAACHELFHGYKGKKRANT